MSKQVMMINVTHAEESRVAIVADGVLEAFEIETFDYKSQKGNIYKAKVESVHSGLQAAFIDIGMPRSGFLPLDELNFKVNPCRHGQQGRVENHLARGQEILVQVVRDAFGTKPPTLSTYFSLPGRYLVLTPFADSAGISRKLDDADRERVRKLLDGLPIPENFGVIVRTAGASATKTELARDLRYLLRLWEKIEAAAKTVRAPKLIYQERSLVIRAVRDLFTPDIDEILVDDPATHQEILDFFEVVLPNKKSIVKHYSGDRPIFNKFNLEEQIENIFRRRITLPSGGAIVFDVAEALTAIDVNSSRMKNEGDVEQTAFRANLEAAEEIGRQLRLRDMGGLVVIDFIDMRSSKNQRAIEKKIKDALKKDKARYDMTKLSRLGLMEISRERLNPEKSSLRYSDCPNCEGTGSIKTLEAAAVQAIRRLQTRVVRGDLENIEITVPPDVAEYLLNQKRADLVGWEERYKTHIVIHGDPAMIRDGCDIRTAERERSREASPVVAAPTHQEILSGISDQELEEAERAAQAAADADGDGDDAGEEGGGKRRRRRRRGGRRRRKGKELAAGETGGNVDESTAVDDNEDDAEGDEEVSSVALESGAGDDAAHGGESSEDGGKRRRRRRRRRRRGGNGNGATESADAAELRPVALSGGDVAALPSAAASPVSKAPLAVHKPVLPQHGEQPAPRMKWWRALVLEAADPPVTADDRRDEPSEAVAVPELT